MNIVLRKFTNLQRMRSDEFRDAFHLFIDVRPEICQHCRGIYQHVLTFGLHVLVCLTCACDRCQALGQLWELQGQPKIVSSKRLVDISDIFGSLLINYLFKLVN